MAAANAIAPSRTLFLVEETPDEHERIDNLCSFLSTVRAVAGQIEVIARGSNAPDVPQAHVEQMVQRVRALLEGAVSLARATSGPDEADPDGTLGDGILPPSRGEVPHCPG